ncbi:MAG: LysR family transcriptional regulator, partial [Deltaproteobacteria bacterium]|nr:LysR family transcriptional regulator [Deltaproteobacteria bacterium]
LPVRDLSIIAEFGSTASIKEAVKAGIGAAFLPEVAVRDELGMGLLRAVEIESFPPVERAFYAVRDPQRRPSPAAEAFLAFLLESVGA